MLEDITYTAKPIYKKEDEHKITNNIGAEQETILKYRKISQCRMEYEEEGNLFNPNDEVSFLQ